MHNAASIIINTIGVGCFISATIGDPIVTILPRTLQHPYAVESNTVGNNSGTIKNAKSKNATTPKFVMSMKTQARRDSLASSFEIYKKVKNTPPMTISPQEVIIDFCKEKYF